MTASIIPCVIGDEPNCEEQFCHCYILFSWGKETIMSKNRLLLLGKNEDLLGSTSNNQEKNHSAATRWRSEPVIYEHSVLGESGVATSRVRTQPETFLHVLLPVILGGKPHVAEPPLAYNPSLLHHGRGVHFLHMLLESIVVPERLLANFTIEILLFESPTMPDLGTRFGLGGGFHTLGRIS